MWGNRKMDLEKVQEKQHISMEVFTKENGKMIKKMEMEFFSTLMEPNMMDNGKTISVTDLEHTFILMETNMKVIGIMIFNKEWGHIIMLMEIYTRDNGKVENQMEKVITFTRVEKPYTRVIGRMERKKASDNL